MINPKLGSALKVATCTLLLLGTSSFAQVESKTLEFEADWAEVGKKQKAGSRSRFTQGLNFSFINYDESAFSEPHTEKAATFKAALLN